MGNRRVSPSQESSNTGDETTRLTQVIEALQAEIAERKRAEARFRKLLEATPDAMVIVDNQGEIVLANTQAETLFGYRQEVLVGQVVEVLIPEGFQDKHRQHRAGYFASPQVRPMGVELELYARRRDGTQFPVEISLSPLQTEDEILVLAAIRDVSRRKRVEEALSQSEERFRIALKSSPLVVSHQDRELRFTWIYNPPPGFSAEDVLGKTDADLLPPEDAKWLTEIKRRVLANGEGEQQEFQIGLGGDVHFYDLTIEPLRDSGGQIVGVTSAAVDITEHKRAQERFRKLLEATPDAMIIVDEEGKIVLTNAQAEALFGYPQKILVGQSVEVLIPQRFREKHKQHRVGYSAQPQVRPMGMGLDLYALCQDGTEFPAEISLSPLQTEEGVLFLAAIRDVSDRKQAEMTLQQAYDSLESQITMQAAELSQMQKDLRVQSSPDKSVGKELARFTNQLRIVADVSRQINTVLDSDELLPKVVSLLQHRFDFYYVHIFLLDSTKNTLVMRAGSGDAGKRMRQQQYGIPGDAKQSLVAHAARSKQIISVPDVTKETRFLPNPLLPQTRSEIVVPLLAGNELLGVLDVQDNQPYRFGQSDVYIFGSLAGHIATALQNARLFEESRRSQEAYRHLATIVETSNDAIIGMDLAGRFISWNAAAERLYGYSPAETIGQSTEIIVPVERHQEPAQILDSIQRGQSIAPFETVRMTKDGRRVHVSLTVSPLTDHEGRTTGASIIARDISKRKRAEETLRERTLALERSNQELEQFAYVASHDLQEPLRMVTSYMQLLARRYQGQLDADADAFIAFAVDGANRMKNLIDDLLAYSRIGTRGKALAPVDSGALLAQVLTDLQFTIEESRAKITYDPLPTVVADRSQLAQVFRNLVGNAFKFRSDQPPVVHISVARQEDDWVFSVHDNGIGIDPEYGERIFVIFQRLHNREEYPGTGIGLAICKKIVERHGGRIWVESEPGYGSIFHFTLPFRELVEPAPEEEGLPETLARKKTKDTVALRARDLI
jgi:PAS domain S-box-containing protein